MKTYTGIGSRLTPNDILVIMTDLADKLENIGYKLRSGGAYGADLAFEKGVKDHHNKEIYFPSKKFNSRIGGIKSYGLIDSNSFIKEDIKNQSIELVKKFHPVYYKLNDFSKLLMMRNNYQVLGSDLKSPSDFIICWTEDGKIIGGTGQALRLANYYEIKIYNLGIKEVKESIYDLLEI